MNDNRYQLLAALSGIAVKCIIAFCWERRQLTITELEPRVGHDKSTVRKALAQLALYGLAGQVIATQETWCLTDKGFQLPLPLDSLPASIMSTDGEKFSPLTTTTSILTSSPDEAVVVVAPGGENFTSNLETLHAHGIMGKKAETIAALKWVTPDYIAAHVAKVKLDGQRLGLAIHRMEMGDPKPESEDDTTSSWNKYLGGKYADHIDH
jgi:hypothetical protein